jgi:hypothetical protein
LNQRVYNHEPRGFAATLTTSLLLAAAALVGPFFWDSASGLKFWFCVIVLPVLWTILTAAAFFRYRSGRWFWFLLGLPLAFWWLYFLASITVTNNYP